MEIIKSPSKQKRPAWAKDLRRVNCIGQLAQLLQEHHVVILSFKLPPRKPEPWDQPRRSP